MTKKSDAPAIRFKGFSDAWEQRKFDEVFDCTVPNNTLSRAELSYDEGTVLNVHYGDVLIKYGSVLDVQKDDIPRIPHRCREDFNGALLQDGDVIIADTAEDETTGKACEIGNLQGSAIVSGLHTMVCRPRNRMALGYLGYYLNSNAYHHQLLPLMQGIKVLSLSRSNIQKTSVSYPIAVKEQQLIAYYFSQLDNLITLHQRKFEKLTNVKKSMLEKMFPQNGCSYPEIRFKGFTDAWEQRKVLSCIQKITDFRGRTPKKLGMDWSESGYLALSALNVKDGYIDFSQDVHYGDQALYDKWMSGNELHKGQVLFTTEAPMGNVAQVPDNRQYILSQRTIAFDVREDIITENFLATLLRSPAVFNTLTSLSSGGTAKGVSQKSLAGVEVRIPVDLREQALLATYFHNLDNLITLHQRELEKLQNIKKSMLEKMFV